MTAKKDIRLMAFVMSAMFWGSWAMANEVNLTTDGEDNDITINQIGSGNAINGGGLTTPAFVGGNGNVIIIDQLGADNTLNLSINDSTAAAAGLGTNVTVNTDGSGNDQTIRCGTSTNASCAASVITTTISGNDNITQQLLDSTGKNTSIVSITGSFNTVKHNTTGGTVATANITVNGLGGVGSGSNNYVELNQSGATGTARSATITQSGSNNSIIVNQHTSQ